MATSASGSDDEDEYRKALGLFLKKTCRIIKKRRAKVIRAPFPASTRQEKLGQEARREGILDDLEYRWVARNCDGILAAGDS